VSAYRPDSTSDSSISTAASAGVSAASASASRRRARHALRRRLQISGHDADRARRYLAVTEHYGLDDRLALSVGNPFLPMPARLGHSACPFHRHGGRRLLRPRHRPWDIARLLDRGARSSVGIATFAAGGIVLDGGRPGEAPPILSRFDFRPGASY
jgi:hypothetical protein